MWINESLEESPICPTFSSQILMVVTLNALNWEGLAGGVSLQGTSVEEEMGCQPFCKKDTLSASVLPRLPQQRATDSRPPEELLKAPSSA